MQDPLKIIQVCSIDDEAIDTEAMGDSLAEYAKTHDPHLLRFKSEKRPVVFMIGNMTPGYIAGAISTARGELSALRAVLACVHEVQLSDGETLTPEKLEKGDFEQKVATPSWLQRLREYVDYDRIVEIGIVATDLAKLSEKKRRPFELSVGLGAKG